MKIAVAGMGYVGLSNAVLLAQHQTVLAYDVVPEKAAQINSRISPIADPEIETYLKERELDLSATTDPEEAFREADYVVISTPTDYDPEKNYFNTSTVETVAEQVRSIAPQAGDRGQIHGAGGLYGIPHGTVTGCPDSLFTGVPAGGEGFV